MQREVNVKIVSVLNNEYKVYNQVSVLLIVSVLVSVSMRVSKCQLFQFLFQ